MARLRVKYYNDPRMPQAETERVLRDICGAIGFPPREVHLRATNNQAVQARRVVTWTLRRVTRVAFPQLAAFLTKDHSTLVHADQMWEKALKEAKASGSSIRSEMARMLRAIYRAHKSRMRGERPVALSVRKLKLDKLVYLGDMVRYRNRSLRKLLPTELPTEGALSPLAEVAFYDHHYNGTSKGFFVLQNDKAVEHMKKALEQERKERGR